MAFIRVESPNVKYTDDGFIISDYTYRSTRMMKNDDEIRVIPMETKYTFRTGIQTPKKFGLLMVGWGGNNGSTVTAGILANRLNLSWRTRNGIQKANFYGSLTQSSTLRLGLDHSDVIPFNRILPMIDPRQILVGGWDINGANLAEAMERAQVLEPDLQRQLEPYMKEMHPMKSIYYPDFIAANQKDRADNLMDGDCKKEHLQQIRQDIRKFKMENQLDSLVVIWTANTERYSEIIPGVNDTAESLLRSIEKNHSEIAPSTLFAVASILEGVPFVNGSPQNTFVPGCVELAEHYGVYIGGDDFKTGQTKLKSVLVDFLVGAGIKPVAITSYNHLGNNDGRNLSAPQQFRSKEISKSSVVDDMVESNPILYEKGEKPDHVVVIKYVPAVADSKRALDEYYNEIFLGGKNTIAIHNTCEDSLLAAPLIIDLAILTELFTRITYKTSDMPEYAPFHSILSILSYLLKAPLVPNGTPVVNALFRQRQGLENILRACAGLPPQNDMMLECKAFNPQLNKSAVHLLPRFGAEMA